MSGNSSGAKKAYQTRLERHGKENLKKMHSAGGKSSHVGGFGTKEIGKDGLNGKERAKMASVESHRMRKHNLIKDYDNDAQNISISNN